MHFRQKKEAIRVTFDNPAVTGEIEYAQIDIKKCWCSTFNAWGKNIGGSAPVIRLGGKVYLIKLEQVGA